MPVIAVDTVVAVAQSAEIGRVVLVPKFTVPTAPGDVVMVLPYASFTSTDAVTDPPTASWVLLTIRDDVENDLDAPLISSVPGLVVRSPREVTPSVMPTITALFE